MKISLLSDTHSTLPSAVLPYLKESDEIWHAGDIGSMAVAEQLTNLKPLRAVHGNIDTSVIRKEYPAELFFNCGGLAVYITHIAGKPPHYNPTTQLAIKRYTPDILVCGHTHILHIQHKNGILHINPGAIGDYGIHPIKTLIQFEIKEKKVQSMQVIEIGNKRY